MSETEQEFYDDLLGRGAGDPDFHGYPVAKTAEPKAECIKLGEHFKRILSENGNDVCFNCGEID